MGSLSMFMNLPMPVKAAIFVVTGGGIMGLMFFLSGSGMFGNALSYLLLIAMAVAALIFGIYKVISKKMGKRKAKPFEQKMADSASATPSGVSDPGSRAQLDDLRKRFEEGISVFKEHGKDLYTMPWYVIVGEPGSGKTEAMRHSNVGFPPGLQDQLQGVGGTVNMHWWFTNHAVMIDTAGRLMFEDIEPGQTSEWAEFLKMLRTARPNCPLNGMLLVIPADSLIKDSANDIERKGGKIAQQLDNIQRALGVRFPVYIVISKADRINGFREFFEELTDPVMQMQMMGWTNPTDLDTPFDPSMVEQHLTSVRERLVRRRFSLLTDPVNSDDPMGRRVDQVDALYAFPDSLVKLAPRLRRYLEMVFVAGEWSQKPLFLRGIYFTSSMREGDALDADLAEVLGVQVDALKEGKLWERDRSYFLKDVFMEKVFREKGLVTRESNVGKSRRRQSTILILCGLLLAIGIGFWTWYSYSRLEQSIAGPSRDWGAIAELVEDDLSGPSARRMNPSIALVQPRTGRYMGAKSNPVKSAPAKEWTRLEVQEKAAQYAQRSRDGTLKTDLIFKFAAATTGSVFGQMPEVQQILFDRYVLLPFVDEARRRMADPSIDTAQEAYANWRERLTKAGREGPAPRGKDWVWSQNAIDALAALIEIEAVGLDETTEYTPARYESWLMALGNFPNQGEGEPRRFRGPQDKDAEGKDTALNDWDGFTTENRKFIADEMFRRFGADGKGTKGSAGVAETLRADADYSVGAAKAGIVSFVETWRAGGSGGTSLLGQLDAFASAGRAYLELERRVAAYPGFDNAKTSAEFEANRIEWLGLVDALGLKKVELESVLKQPVVLDPSRPTETKTLLEVIGSASPDSIRSQAMTVATREVETVFGRLLKAIPSGLEEAEGRGAALADMRKRLSDRQTVYMADLTTSVDGSMAALQGANNAPGLLSELATVDPSSSQAVFVVRFDVLDRTARQLRKEQPKDSGVFGFVDAVKGLDTDLASARIPTVASGTSEAMKGVITACQSALSAYKAFHTTAWVRGTLTELGSPDKDIGSLVSNASLAAPAGERAGDFNVEGVPWLSSEQARLDRQFDETVAKNVLASIDELRTKVTGNERMFDSEAIQGLWGAVENKLEVYRNGYIAYWTESVPKIFSPGIADGSWKSAHDALWEMNEETVFSALISVTDRSTQALKMLDGTTAAERVAPYVRQLADDRQGLNRGGSDASTLRRDASAMRGGWKDLSNDLSVAFERLNRQLKADPFVEETFKAKYFAVYSGAPMTPARTYWSGVVEVLLAAMNNGLGGEEATKRRALREIGPKFPLAIDGRTEMSVTEYETAKGLIKWLSARAVAAGGENQKIVEVNGLPATVADELRNLQRGAAVGQPQVDLIKNLEAAVTVIDATKELSFQLPPRAANEAFANDHQFVRVLRNGQPIPSLPDGASYTTDSTPTELLTLPVPSASDRLELQFWSVQKDYTDKLPVQAIGVLSGPWHGLHCVAYPAEPDGSRLLPLEMPGGGGAYRIRVTGLKASVAAWPTVEDWERAGK